MKKRRFAFLYILIAVISIALLASCSVVPEESETENFPWTETETGNGETETEVIYQISQDPPQETGWAGAYNDDLLIEMGLGRVVWAGAEHIELFWTNYTDDPLYINGFFQIELWNGESWLNCTPDDIEYDLSVTEVPSHYKTYYNNYPTYPVAEREYDVRDFDFWYENVDYRMIVYYSDSPDLSDPKPMVVEFNSKREASWRYSYETRFVPLLHSDSSPKSGESSEAVCFWFNFMNVHGDRDPREDREAYQAGASPEQKELFERLYVNLNQEEGDNGGFLPVLARIDSAEDIPILKSFSTYNQAWVELADSFKESFFETKTILVLFWVDGVIGYFHDLEPITVTEQGLSMNVAKWKPRENGSVLDAPQEFLALLIVNRDDIAHCTEFEVWLTRK